MTFSRNKLRDPGTESGSTSSGSPTLIDSSTAQPDTAPTSDPPTTRVFDPINNFIVDAIRWHKLLVTVIAVVCALFGAAVGLLRQPVYTASASLQVGQVNPSSPGFGNYTDSTAALASAFSRAINASAVLAEIQQKLGLTPVQSSSRLSSEPIPASPMFRVIGTGSSERGAVDLTNAAASSVVGYVARSNSSTSEAQGMLHDYVTASRAVRSATAAQNHLSASASPRAQVKAQAALSAATAKRDAIYRSYVAAVGNQESRAGLVSILADANTATDDRRAKAQLYGFLGLLIGIALGTAAALWRERRIGASALAPPDA